MKPFIAAVPLLAVAITNPALAEGDLSRENVVDVTIELGSSDDGMYMKPDVLEFETGKAYRLILVNVDEIKHEVALNEMGERVFTRKIEATDPDGNLIAEVKGHINEVEVGPGKTVDWYIVPVQTMEASEITCELPGHLEAGMRASATIK
ncbi:cupredoxin domain-containing protein [Oricola cellulosilytica]|uniref:Biphenyl 2,3-dioxygenase n=1 Tax=Oricola cellulosilytica TaxID=1429082 RepID=A0A4R0PEL9_9HYPH|nr:biphenyl 2,3-dioxygenase [Oricola cellulosilytica]TCD16257.1 biphenyl 2,3-dioxygenase [Oricola cellulosilytica]